MHGSQPFPGLVSINRNQSTQNNMNRIQHLATDFESSFAECGTGVVESGRFENLLLGSSQLAFFSPLHYERNYAYPLIIWLHGGSDDERQLKRIMPLVSMRNYVAVAPRGTLAAEAISSESGQTPAAGRGFFWNQTPKHIAEAETRVFAAIASARHKFNIAPSRIFLAGFADGGTMAIRLALSHPRTFAGAASFGGTFPSGHSPLRQISDARRLKILLATGRDSINYPPEKVCEHLRLFHVAGMSVCLRQYPCGDDLTTSMLGDLDRWIMDQIISPTPASTEEASTRQGR